MIVYKITNLINEKIYVGKTTRSLEKRFSEHRHSKVSLLAQDMEKYGFNNFTAQIIEECRTVAELNERERFWIRTLNSLYPNGYNFTDGVHCSKNDFIDKSYSYRRHKQALDASEELGIFLKLVGGKWKIHIILRLFQRPWRYNELKKSIAGISQKVLTDNLRWLEADGLIKRKVFNEKLAHVEYSLSELGWELKPVFDALHDFGVHYREIVNDA